MRPARGRGVGRIGVARETVSRRLARYGAGGDRALDAPRRGRRVGHVKLSEAQQQMTAGPIAGKNPDQLKLSGSVWTRALVVDMIARELGIKLGEDTVRRYAGVRVLAQEAEARPCDWSAAPAGSSPQSNAEPARLIAHRRGGRKSSPRTSST